MPQPVLVSSIQALKEPELLKSSFVGYHASKPVLIDTGGYSGARFYRISLTHRSGKSESLILKEVILADDWFSHRTRDLTGREAFTVSEPTLTQIHEIFQTPYRQVSIEKGKIGLLMNDLSAGLFPDEKTPISVADQDLMLDKLAQMHAYYWNSPKLASMDWLQSIGDFIYIMGPLDHKPFQGGSARNIQEAIRNGWEATLPQLPEKVRRMFLSTPEVIAAEWQHLPKTLVHGDTKVANFAKDSRDQLSLFDWAFAGHAPCTADLGWFLAVNASRLADTKEAVIRKYKSFLEKHLGHELDHELWHQLEQFGIVCGAFMLLWSKGTAMANHREGADMEWNWWLHRLEGWANKY